MSFLDIIDLFLDEEMEALDEEGYILSLAKDLLADQCSQIDHFEDNFGMNQFGQLVATHIGELEIPAHGLTLNDLRNYQIDSIPFGKAI